MEPPAPGPVINVGGEEEEEQLEQAVPIELMEASNTDESKQQIHEEEEEASFEIEAIVDDAMIDGVLHYRVKWLGFGQEEDTWEPEENLTACQDLIELYRAEKESKEAEGSTKNESEYDAGESDKPKPAESENDQTPKKKKHQWDSEDMEFDQPKGNTVLTESEEEIVVKTPQRTSNIVTRLQYQKQFFGSGSSSDVPPAAILDEEEADSDGYADVKPKKKRSKPSPKAKATKGRSVPKKRAQPVHASSSDDESNSDSDAGDDYKRVTGVTVHSNGEMQFEVVRTDGKIRHVAKDDLWKYHTRVYLRFLEKLVATQ